MFNLKVKLAKQKTMKSIQAEITAGAFDGLS